MAQNIVAQVPKIMKKKGKKSGQKDPDTVQSDSGLQGQCPIGIAGLQIFSRFFLPIWATSLESFAHF